MLFSLQEEISSLKQGDMTVQSYHAKLKNLWGDEDSMTTQDTCELGSACKSTQSMLAKKDLDRSMKFLMGLNEAFFQIRSHILSMEPLPGLEKIYSMILQHQIQIGIGRVTIPEVAAFVSNNNSSWGNALTNYNAHNQGENSVTQRQGNENYGNHKGKKSISSTYCHGLGHTREFCYKLNGYPPGHKLHKPGQQGNIVIVNKITTDVSHARKESTVSTEDQFQLGSVRFNQDQLNRLMALIDNTGNENDHMAGISYLTSVTINELD